MIQEPLTISRAEKKDGNEIFAYILSLRTLEYRAKIHPMLPQEFFSEQNR